MGIPADHPAIQQAISRGLIAGDSVPPASRKAKPPVLVEAEVVYGQDWLPGQFVANVPCEVPSLANSREWRTRNRVTQAHRKAVSRTLGPHLRALSPFAEHYHRGGVLKVVLTRLGGKTLDRMANLPASLKYIEDAVCLMLGAEDSAANWNCRCEQEPGGACGVRVTIETA